MKTLLVINSSGRVTRSITRRLTARFTKAWSVRNPGSRIIERDVGTNAPPPVDEAWIAAAFADLQSEETPEALRESDRFIDEIIAADLIVLGAPIYNLGMPAQLKAYFDQVVRVGRTVAVDPETEEAEDVYRPLLENKPVVIITSAGDAAMHPGGAFWHMNHLEPYLHAVLNFIGLTNLHFIRAAYDELPDDQAKRSIAKAEDEVDWLVNDLILKTALEN